VRHRKNDQPLLELQARAHAREICFYVVGDPQTHTEGAVEAEQVTQRDGLPSRILPNVRYRDVQISTRIAVWLTLVPEAGHGDDDGHGGSHPGRAADDRSR
jgi:hypothetical protein